MTYSKDLKAPPIKSSDVADAINHSIGAHHNRRRFNPEDQGDLLTLARWGRSLGIEAMAREAFDIPKTKARVSTEVLAAWIRRDVSPHPAKFEEMVEAAREVERWALARDSERLKACGNPWGRVVRLFWKDRKGRERVRTLGLHACKHRLCPRCGRSRQLRLSDEIERCLELAREWGFTESHVRFVTLTVKNGKTIPALREQAHHAWAKLQRTRWWPRHVFGWFRGTEVVTGADGNWNLHLHVPVILWSQWISYQELGRVWTREAGGREGGKNLVVDIEKLRQFRAEAKGRGITRAARYIVKYMTKREEFNRVRNGPDGISHLDSSTKGMRSFAVGGGCSILRRLLPVLLPKWAHRAEQALGDSHLSGGLAPWRAEEVDPQTGEAIDVEAPSPFVDEQERNAWKALARPLEQMGGFVGAPCGPGFRFRRLGALPLRSTPPTVDAWRKTESLNGLRSHVARGQWAIFQWEEEVKVYRRDGRNRVATGAVRTLKRSAVLPSKRYAWRPIMGAVWRALVEDPSLWGARRSQAYQDHADAKVRPIDFLDCQRAILAASDDRVTLGRREDGTPRITTRRRVKARELQDLLIHWMGNDPEKYLERCEALRGHIKNLRAPKALDLKPPSRPEPTFLEGFF